MKTYKRYRGHKPGATYRTICRALCCVGFVLVLVAAGNSDMGEPLCRVIPLLVGGIALFIWGGCRGELFR